MEYHSAMKQGRRGFLQTLAGLVAAGPVIAAELPVPAPVITPAPEPHCFAECVSTVCAIIYQPGTYKQPPTRGNR
jgi:hypothetical protein